MVFAGLTCFPVNVVPGCPGRIFEFSAVLVTTLPNAGLGLVFSYDRADVILVLDLAAIEAVEGCLLKP